MIDSGEISILSKNVTNGFCRLSKIVRVMGYGLRVRISLGKFLVPKTNVLSSKPLIMSRPVKHQRK